MFQAEVRIFKMIGTNSVIFFYFFKGQLVSEWFFGVKFFEKTGDVIYEEYLIKMWFVGEHLEDLAYQMEAVVPNYEL